MKTGEAAIALCVVLLAGCASAPRVARIDHGIPVAFEIVMSQPARSATAVHDTAVIHDAGSGAKTGAAAGALSGLFCGPAFLICSPLGALVGAGAGVAAGATVGLAEVMPKDKVAQLDERLKRLQQSVDPLHELRMSVRDKAAKHWELTDDTSMRVVTMEVQNLYLTADRNENIALVMQVLVSQRDGTISPTRPSAPTPAAVTVRNSSV